MKNTKLFLALAAFLFPTIIFATDSTVCTKDKMERRVEVTSTDSKKAPCEVKYFKDSTSEGKVLWSAKNKSEYCTEKAQAFIAKLGTDGWVCSGGQSATAPAVKESKAVDPVKSDPAPTNPKADTKAPAEKTAPAAAVKK